MKLYVSIFTSLFFVFNSCRSKSNITDSSLQKESEVFQEQRTTRNIQQEIHYLEVSKTHTNTQIEENTRITKYYPDGSISEIQEKRRNTGRNKLEDSSRSGSDVSGVDSTAISNAHSTENENNTIHSTSKTDSRLVQNEEWIYVIVSTSIGAILLIIWLVKRKK